MSESKKSVKTVLGTMAIGSTLKKDQANHFLNYYKERGYKELDSAIMYGSGKTEVVLGHLAAASQFIISTKANPWFENGKTSREQKASLTPEGIAVQLKLSLSRLQTKCVDIFYLHAPDHITPIQETLQAVNKAYIEGKFKIFAISNYSAWQVAQICEICRANQWIEPQIYQGMYNVFTRDVESDLFACLRNYKISFYAYNPLAGGILSGKYNRGEDPSSGRFNAKTGWGKAYRMRFWNDSVFDALESMESVLQVHNTSILEASIRWLYHHSALQGDQGDAVILGASSVDHLEANLNAAEAGPLHVDIVNQFNAIAQSMASRYPQYYR